MVEPRGFRLRDFENGMSIPAHRSIVTQIIASHPLTSFVLGSNVITSLRRLSLTASVPRLHFHFGVADEAAMGVSFGNLRSSNS